MNVIAHSNIQAVKSALQPAADRLGVRLDLMQAKDGDDLGHVFAAMTAWRDQAVVVVAGVSRGSIGRESPSSPSLTDCRRPMASEKGSWPAAFWASDRT